jgi:hypothetical protein
MSPMEETMKTGPAFVGLFAAFSAMAFVTLPVLAAKSPAMEACSKQWDDMKAAGRTEGKTWPSFWSECSKEFAAKNGGETAAPEKPTKTEKASKKSAASARNEDDNPNSAAQKKDCDAKWDANKTKTGAHGWHDYFQFMSRCM